MINRVLAQVCLALRQVGNHPVGISPVPECIIGIDIHWQSPQKADTVMIDPVLPRRILRRRRLINLNTVTQLGSQDSNLGSWAPKSTSLTITLHYPYVLMAWEGREASTQTIAMHCKIAVIEMNAAG